MFNLYYFSGDKCELVKIDGCLVLHTESMSIRHTEVGKFSLWLLCTIECQTNVNVYTSVHTEVTFNIGEFSLIDTLIADYETTLVEQARTMIADRLGGLSYSRSMAQHIVDSALIEGVKTL